MGKINKTKEKILEFLWKVERSAGHREIAEKLGLKIRSVNMHLLGLTKLGYTSRSKNGAYKITTSGKEAIGLPKVDAKTAKKILSKTPPEKAFHFYKEIGQPLGVFSDSLTDFHEKLKTIDVKSILFHTSRGDFERWVSSLGDVELAKRLRTIRETGLAGEALRRKLCEAVRSRCDELLKKKK